MTVPTSIAIALLCALQLAPAIDREVPEEAQPIDGAAALFGLPAPPAPVEPRGPSSDDEAGVKLGGPAALGLRLHGGRRPIELRPSEEVDRARIELNEGRLEAATSRLRRYLEELPGASDEPLARALLDKAERARARLLAESGRLQRADEEERLIARRLELMTGVTLYSAWLGIGTQVIFELDDVPGLLPFGSAGIGLLLSGLATEGVALEQGDAALVSASILFGTLNGFGLGALADSDTPQDWLANATLVGGLALGGAALTIGPLDRHPDAGQVALATTFGTWSTFAAGMGVLAFDPDLASDRVLILLALSADAGLVAGALLSIDTIRISRYEAVLLDGAGLAGVAGGGLAYLVVSSSRNEAAGSGTAAALLSAGAVAGIGIGWIAGRDDGLGEEAPLVHLRPTLVPGAAGPAFGLALDLGGP